MIQELGTGIQKLSSGDLFADFPDNFTNIASRLSDELQATGKIKVFPKSYRMAQGVMYFLCAFLELQEKRLILIAKQNFVSQFEGERQCLDGIFVHEVPLNWGNTLILHKLFPFTKPTSLRAKKTTIGCGDRLGLASSGHIMAMNLYGEAYPVLAQQSIRELTLTKRSFKEVVTDVSFQVFQEGFERGYGADGDHLKNLKDIDQALDAEMPMITLDMSEKLHPERVEWSADQVKSEFANLPEQEKRLLLKVFSGKRWRIGDDPYSFSLDAIYRCAAIYLDAIRFAKEVDKHIQTRRGSEYDLEISIDETTLPTQPLDHLFIAASLLAEEVGFTSLAPRFIGEFQKGIDYIGDVEEFRKQFEKHVAIADHFGTYKISVHSGSDKYSVFGIIGKATGRNLHLKTSGTSWLEAVRIIAVKNPGLYRMIHQKALQFFPEASKYYHVRCEPQKVRPLDSVDDRRLIEYLDDEDARQLLHITYGGVLAEPDLREKLFLTLYKNHETLDQYERNNICRHLDGLAIEKGPPSSAIAEVR